MTSDSIENQFFCVETHTELIACPSFPIDVHVPCRESQQRQRDLSCHSIRDICDHIGWVGVHRNDLHVGNQKEFETKILTSL